ncbi:MAG: DHH family phosphoesterase, partial [Clostridia bacterium]|nr:DHH family phosphoesterase [Clostridia bacterium]
DGRLVTVNDAFRTAFELEGTLFDRELSELIGISPEKLIHRSEYVPVSTEEETDATDAHSEAPRFPVGTHQYHVDCHPVRTRNHPYYLLVFYDVTDYEELYALHRAEHPIVAYVVLDNLDEIAQYIKVSYQDEAGQAGKFLKEWADSMGGILREYEKNKYILFFNRQALRTCINNKFEILDEIRQIRIGSDSIPVTVSIGVSALGDSLAAREHDSLVALDMALQRGGDQVVVKMDTGVFYFGGKTKTLQKRSRSSARVNATRLCSLMSSASNIIVMGHSNPDFDSIGACIGIAALANHLGKDIKIVADTECDSFQACTSRLIELATYKDIFIDGATGLEVSNADTLLIVVDANNFAILEEPELARMAFHVAVIDHHIQKEEFQNEPVLCYIDPSASSTCELISELLEQTLPAGVLRSEEANLLMAGIMVDTKNFTRTVGTRTFSAALYLRDAGARTEYARTFFEEPFEDYRAEALFGTEAKLYRDSIAITALPEGKEGGRIAAAKAADKLLSVRQVCAAFALVSVGNAVHISARSDGSINVQLILERIGGGGLFDVAGAALKDSSVEAAEERLKQAIDDYFEAAKQSEGN